MSSYHQKTHPLYYEGFPETGAVERVFADRRDPLDPRLDLENFLFNRYLWGCAYPGATQLALALLADAVGDDAFAGRHCLRYESVVVRKLTYGARFQLARADVLGWALREAIGAFKVARGAG